MSIRSIAQIGAIWPRCTTCGHIAQAHSETYCSETRISQCPTCFTTGVQVKCGCKGYIGMTTEEWRAKLTPEEIAYYHFAEGLEAFPSEKE